MGSCGQKSVKDDDPGLSMVKTLLMVDVSS